MSKYTHRQGATAHPEYMLDFLTNKLVTVGGVFDTSLNHFLVEQQSVANMTVKVAVGTAFLFKSGSSKVYPVYMDAVENVTIGANASGSTRNDAIVMYVNLGVTANTDATNVVQLVAIQGASGGSAPSDADIETAIGSSNPYIRLANVEVVNGATSIVTAKITDTRVNATYSTQVIPAQLGDWLAVTGTITRASADDPTYVMTIAGVDWTASIGVGMRLKWTQNSIVRYGIVTAIAFSTNTTVTVLTSCNDANANYDMLDTGTYPITLVYYSTKKFPVGFPPQETFWTVEYINNTAYNQSDSGATVYNLGSCAITVPIGAWRLTADLTAETRKGSATRAPVLIYGLSTANNSFSDANMQGMVSGGGASGSQEHGGSIHIEKPINIATKTVYYLVEKGENQDGTIYLNGNGDVNPVNGTVLRAISRLL